MNTPLVRAAILQRPHWGCGVVTVARHGFDAAVWREMPGGWELQWYELGTGVWRTFRGPHLARMGKAFGFVVNGRVRQARFEHLVLPEASTPSGWEAHGRLLSGLGDAFEGVRLDLLVLRPSEKRVREDMAEAAPPEGDRFAVEEAEMLARFEPEHLQHLRRAWQASEWTHEARQDLARKTSARNRRNNNSER